jgi:hypothetical protein
MPNAENSKKTIKEMGMALGINVHALMPGASRQRTVSAAPAIAEIQATENTYPTKHRVAGKTVKKRRPPTTSHAQPIDTPPTPQSAHEELTPKQMTINKLLQYQAGRSGIQDEYKTYMGRFFGCSRTSKLKAVQYLIDNINDDGKFVMQSNHSEFDAALNDSDLGILYTQLEKVEFCNSLSINSVYKL